MNANQMSHCPHPSGLRWPLIRSLKGRDKRPLFLVCWFDWMGYCVATHLSGIKLWMIYIWLPCALMEHWATYAPVAVTWKIRRNEMMWNAGHKSIYLLSCIQVLKVRSSVYMNHIESFPCAFEVHKYIFLSLIFRSHSLSSVRQFINIFKWSYSLWFPSVLTFHRDAFQLRFFFVFIFSVCLLIIFIRNHT